MKRRVYINSERNSSIELLRLIAMFFVVLSHCSVHGAFPRTSSNFSFNSCLLDWMTLGNLGTDIFVVLTGWNLYGKKFSFKSIFNLIVQVWTTSMLGLIVYSILENEMSAGVVIKSMFPIISGSWWFATAYFVMILLTPYINAFVLNTSRTQFRYCLLTMIILWCIIPTFSSSDMYGNQLAQIIMFYLIGAYLRKYPSNFFNHRKHAMLIGLISGMFLLLSSVVIRMFNSYITLLPFRTTMLYGRTSVLVICCTVSMVALAVYAIPRKNSIINTFGACTFGVYLFSEHPLIKDFLWTEWIDNSRYFLSNFLVIRLLASVAIVYFACSLIEWIRLKLFSKPLIRFAEKTCITSSEFVYSLTKRTGKIPK